MHGGHWCGDHLASACPWLVVQRSSLGLGGGVVSISRIVVWWQSWTCPWMVVWWPSLGCSVLSMPMDGGAVSISRMVVWWQSWACPWMVVWWASPAYPWMMVSCIHGHGLCSTWWQKCRQVWCVVGPSTMVWSPRRTGLFNSPEGANF